MLLFLEFLYISVWGYELDLKQRQQMMDAEKYIMRSFLFYAFVLLQWLNQEE